MISELRFFLVFACCGFAFLTPVHAKGRDKYDLRFLQAAFALTVASDYMIILTGDYYAGVSVFCMAHALYFARHTRLLGKKRLGAAVVCAAAVCSIALWVFVYNLYAVSALYTVCLCLALVSSFFVLKTRKYGKNALCMCLGMSSFFMCDVFVVIYNITGATEPALVAAIWLFYFPSLALLCNSAKVYGGTV